MPAPGSESVKLQVSDDSVANRPNRRDGHERIQFAYVVDGVTVPSDDTEPATTDAEQPSLLDRFLALSTE